jgi:predicted RNase H-like nuclease (RuvC/YqgF family)
MSVKTLIIAMVCLSVTVAYAQTKSWAEIEKELETKRSRAATQSTTGPSVNERLREQVAALKAEIERLQKENASMRQELAVFQQERAAKQAKERELTKDGVPTVTAVAARLVGKTLDEARVILGQ